MMRSTASLSLRLFAVVVSFAIVAPAAGAASIPAYTATDLGSVSSGGSLDFTLSNTGANGTLTAPDGQVYAFPRTDNQANTLSVLGALPPLTNAPVYAQMTYGDPKNAYSYFGGNVFLNQAGELVATDIIGVNGHIESAQSLVDTATRQANGSFGPLSTLWSSPNNYYTGGQIAQALDLNNAGQILGVDAGVVPTPNNRDYFLYNLNTGVRTELASLLPTGWAVDRPPIALDDQGRILVYANSLDVSSQNPSGISTELFLLTPAGLSSNPIPAPEPSTLAILAVTGLGLAARRRWRS